MADWSDEQIERALAEAGVAVSAATRELAVAAARAALERIAPRPHPQAARLAPFALWTDRRYEGEGPSLGVLDEHDAVYWFSDGDGWSAERLAREGVEFLDWNTLELRLDSAARAEPGPRERAALVALWTLRAAAEAAGPTAPSPAAFTLAQALATADRLIAERAPDLAALKESRPEL